MKRMFVLGLLALPAVIAADTKALAQNCGMPGSNCGGGPIFGLLGRDNAYVHGCGGFCFRFLGGIHQHGPLYNYGPYAGYYPFAPYGPWDANLNYVGPYPPQGACGWNNCFGGRGCGQPGCGHAGCGGGHAWGGWFARSERGGCNDCGRYSLSIWKNVNLRVRPLQHWGKGKSSCESGCASLDKPAGDVVQTSYPRTER